MINAIVILISIIGLLSFLLLSIVGLFFNLRSNSTLTNQEVIKKKLSKINKQYNIDPDDIEIKEQFLKNHETIKALGPTPKIFA